MIAPATIGLLIVGDADLRFALREQFAGAAAMAVEEAEAPDEALARIEADPHGVLLIADDIAPPGPTALLRAARAADFKGCAILLARRETSTAQGFDASMRRPLRFVELMALIRTRIQTRAFAGAGSSLGGHVFCETTQTLMGSDGVRRLTEKETAILARLAHERGGVVARDVLLREIWGYNPAVTTHTLETHIHRLRRKIENCSRQPTLLLTAPRGYRLKTAADRANVDDDDA
jgi:DNA-binding response OmpR family regulator